MKRRIFLGISTGSAAMLSGIAGCQTKRDKLSRQEPSVTLNDTLAGLTLEELREHYRHDLFDGFLPFVDKYVIDHDLGGFMLNTDRNGRNTSTEKSTWGEGRGIWVYSFLYNEIAKEEKHLDVARKSVEFILKSKPSGDNLWPRRLTKEGMPIGEASSAVYGDLYIAAGLAEYAKASGEETYWDMAKEIMQKCIRAYNRPDYDSVVSNGDLVRGPRRHNIPMLLLPTTTSLLKLKADREVEAIAAECVEVIINNFYNPEFGLDNYILNHDYSRTNDSHAQYVSFGIAIQTLWMVLFEALRLKDKKHFTTSVERIKRHIEVSWDDAYGGMFDTLKHVNNYEWSLSKPRHTQHESLIALLLVIEHTGDIRAKEMFGKLFNWYNEKFPFAELKFLSNFHHPRYLMLNLLALDRMIAREG